MKVLYIDTSSNYLYTAIIEDDSLLCEVKKELGQNLSIETLPEISSMFKKCDIKPSQISKIIVVNGPGSFTGIRIGITIAKVYAWSLNIPITTISSLEAMAISCNKFNIHVPIIDARRSYVYTAIYNQTGQNLFSPRHMKISDLEKELNNYKDYTIISNDKIEIKGVIEKYNPNILKIVKFVKDRGNVNPHSVNPKYLKLTEAEELRNDSRAE